MRANVGDWLHAGRRKPMLLRGESFVAGLGAATAAIIFTVAASGAWWTIRASDYSTVEARYAQVTSISEVLGRTTEAMLAANDWSALRRVMIDVGRSQSLSTCQLTLSSLPGNGPIAARVVADADPTKITLALPDKAWRSGPVDPSQMVSPPGIGLATPIVIPGHGVAVLRVGAASVAAGARRWDLAWGFGLIAAAALATLLLVYRTVRRRALVLGLIRESLLALKSGETARDALGIAATMGPEAEAWNALLNESESVRSASMLERAKDALARPREGRNDLEQACDSLTTGIILIEQNGRVRHANGAAAALLQVKRETLQGSNFAAQQLDDAILRAVAAICTGSGRRETVEVNRGDGGNAGVLRVHVRPLRREDGSGALVTIEDVTQQRVAEASRNAFIAQATHELRAPLTNMRLCLEMAIDDSQQDPAALAESFNVLNRETRRLERMVSEMLSVAEIEAGSLKLSNDDVKLDRLFKELEIDYRHYADEKQIALTFELPPKMPEFFADRDRLTLALHNLIGNAIKYTPAAGHVSVGIRIDGAKLHVDVSDTGIGITEQELVPIFDRFYRSKDPRVSKITGSGLGLALAREIARLHGGEITVQSELNKGSTFTLTVPLTAVPARATAA